MDHDERWNCADYDEYGGLSKHGRTVGPPGIRGALIRYMAVEHLVSLATAMARPPRCSNTDGFMSWDFVKAKVYIVSWGNVGKSCEEPVGINIDR